MARNVWSNSGYVELRGADKIFESIEKNDLEMLKELHSSFSDFICQVCF